MTTTTEASTEAVRSSLSVTVVVSDDAVIEARHFTNHPKIGSYQVLLNYDTSVYLTEESARALVRRLSNALASAHGETSVSA